MGMEWFVLLQITAIYQSENSAAFLLACSHLVFECTLLTVYEVIPWNPYTGTEIRVFEKGFTSVGTPLWVPLRV